MSDQQLGISEIGVSYPDASFGSQSRIGVPFIFVLRDILQFRLRLFYLLCWVVFFFFFCAVTPHNENRKVRQNGG